MEKIPKKNLLGFYIHWPYCLSKCPYCDFYSVVASQINENKLKQAYFKDISFFKYSPHAITSIFFGGGTPSLMSPKLIEQLLKKISDTFSISSDVEITVEANPDAINIEKMKDFNSLGVNRLSVGVQSLNDISLKKLGRRHNAQTALNCLKNAKTVFKNVNADLMYGLPDQTLSDWKEELRQITSLDLEHYSLYQLTVEENTPFAQQKLNLPTEEEAKRFFLHTITFMDKVGKPMYEISNFAKRKNWCRHNLTYWQSGNFIGIGPAAHSRINHCAIETKRDILSWLKSFPTGQLLTPKEQLEEKIIMGMRLVKHGFPVANLNPTGVQKALDNNWISIKKNRVFLTVSGMMVLNQVILACLPD